MGAWILRVQKLDTEPRQKICHGIRQKPCPENDESRVQNLDTNLVREPCVRSDAANIQKGFAVFWEAYPRKRDQDRAMKLFQKAVASGIDTSVIVLAAARYRAENAGNKAMYLAYTDNWLEARRWEDYPCGAALQASSSTIADVAAFWARKVKSRSYIRQTAISQEIAACMISNGLVLEIDLLRAGLRL